MQGVFSNILIVCWTVILIQDICFAWLAAGQAAGQLTLWWKIWTFPADALSSGDETSGNDELPSYGESIGRAVIFYS
jgi:hypothetical protein